MDAFTDPRVTHIVAKMASQVSKTESLVLNPIGYYIDQDPSPIMVVEPREGDAKKTSKSRIAPMVRDTPCLTNKVKESKSRDSDNTILEKMFPGGRLVLTGANSPAGLAGDPIRILLLNEVSRFPPSAGTEGDPVAIAEMRTETFVNRKIAMNSSPTDEGVCRISEAYKTSDRREFYVPCAHCGEFQVLMWKNVKWEKDDNGEGIPSTAMYFCEHCAAGWSEPERRAAIYKGKWIAQAPFNGVAGFWLNALYSPWPNASLENLVKRFLRVKSNPLQLKTFINTVLAEEWRQEYTVLDEKSLLGRREKYPLVNNVEVVPREVIVLTAGVDVQDDRLEVSVFGWGVGDESWLIEHSVIPGDPSVDGTWDDLHRNLTKPFTMERGGQDFIRATCIDTGGHHTQRTYEFCAPRFRLPTPDGRRAYVFAIKGSAGTGDVWPRTPTYQSKTTNAAKSPLYVIRVDPVKDAIYTALSKIYKPGPGYTHFPDWVDDRYFEQLTSERVRVTTDKKGFPKRIWELKVEGRRNEAFDCAVYSKAALYGLRSMGFDLENEAEHIMLSTNEIYDSAETTPVLPDQPTVARRVSQSSYLRRG